MSLYPKSFSVVELFCTIPVSGGLRDVLRAVQVSVILSEERSGRRLIEDKRNIVIGRKVRGIAVDLVVFQDKVHRAGARDKNPSRASAQGVQSRPVQEVGVSNLTHARATGVEVYSDA